MLSYIYLSMSFCFVFFGLRISGFGRLGPELMLLVLPFHHFFSFDGWLGDVSIRLSALVSQLVRATLDGMTNSC